MKINMRGKKWQLVFESIKDFGFCSMPTDKKPMIHINSGLEGTELLDTLIHEMLHACMWDMGEDAVNETATSIATVLAELGYVKE